MDRQCYSCRQTKDLCLFKKDKQRSSGYAHVCRECANTKTYYKRRISRIVDNTEYYQLQTANNGACGICGKTAKENGRRLAVDHCHNTQRIRGLLCKSCNLGLGNFLDDPTLLEKAISYLKKGQS